jgi:hypothetical protein
MNRDLFLSILAMDSYNRGYGQGLLLYAGDRLNGQDELGRRLGNALVVNQTITESAIGASFYAIAYDVSGANIVGLSGTVISYRGTDKFVAEGPEGGDPANGWPLAVGNYAAAQPDLALRFYQSVAGFDTGADPFAAAITTTGHSLGGGLAGMAARRSAGERRSALALSVLPRRLARSSGMWRRSRQVALPLPNAFMAHGCNKVRRR